MAKVVGRPKGSGKFPIRKHIYISEEMNEKWDPKKIREFLSNDHGKKVHSDRNSNKDELLLKIISNLKESIGSYKIEELRQLDIRTREIQKFR
ncbi:hypothetical protein LCGC14_1773490 [marine sediment metagenome]|uniref:Uncharacterized protein n=1 Tax=marine sediment metagenome TaxID=412755 RepID=A0A0F9JX81_9ZZZZ